MGQLSEPAVPRLVRKSRQYDPVADIASPSALTAMRQSCTDLTEVTVPAGHWLHLEAADRVNQCLERWLDVS
jgi:pimeloyl-ACP methyl ester carboxylesterase